MKKSIGIFLSAVFAATLLSGCAPNTPTPTTATPPSAPATAPATATTPATTPAAPTTGSVIMGTNAAFEPFEYVTDKGLVGKFDGVDIAISVEIAKELNKELKVEDMEFNSLLTALSAGSVDFVAAGMTADEERKQSVDFSDTYYVATQYIIAKEGATFKSSKDIADKRVGVMESFTGEKICTDLGYTNLSSFKKATDAVMELKNGKLDAVVLDSHTALALVSKNKGLIIIKDDEVFSTEEYAIAVKKGNTAMLETINKVLKNMKDSGKIDELVAHYSDITGQAQ